VLATAALLLGGCAEVVFKPGASPDQIERDQLACRDTTEDEAAYSACMDERGYHLTKAPPGVNWIPTSR